MHAAIKRRASTVSEWDTCAVLLFGEERVVRSFPARPLPRLSGNDDDSDSTAKQIPLSTAFIDVLSYGFRAKNIFGPNRHVWDFIHKATQSMRAELATDPCGVLIATVSQANERSWPKSVRMEVLVLVGASKHILHEWINLVRRNNLYLLNIDTTPDSVAAFACCRSIL